MNNLKLLTTILLVFVLTACADEESEPVYPATYLYQDIKSNSQSFFLVNSDLTCIEYNMPYRYVSLGDTILKVFEMDIFNGQLFIEEITILSEESVQLSYAGNIDTVLTYRLDNDTLQIGDDQFSISLASIQDNAYNLCVSSSLAVKGDHQGSPSTYGEFLDLCEFESPIAIANRLVLENNYRETDSIAVYVYEVSYKKQ